jgi:hypothetical protein
MVEEMDTLYAGVSPAQFIYLSKHGLLTFLVQMIGLLVANLLIPRRTPRFRPPVGSLLVAPGVRMVRLLLGLDRLDPGLGYQLAGRLLTVAEPLVVEIPHLLGITDLEPLLVRSDRDRGVIIVKITPGVAASRPFSGLHVGKRLIVKVRFDLPSVRTSSAGILRTGRLTVVPIFERGNRLLLVRSGNCCQRSIHLLDVSLE